MSSKTTTIKVNDETKTSAYEITEYLLKKENLTDVTEQFKCKITEWVVKNNNNNYRFAKGNEIKVPQGKFEFARAANEVFSANDPPDIIHTSSPKGWMLTRNGLLVRGRTGWLVDENGLFILLDGRRLNEPINEKMELRIGDANDIWKGLYIILGNANSSIAHENEYETKDLLYRFGPYMNVVVYQAFQINICYNTSSWQTCTRKRTPHVNNGNFIEAATNCEFKSIGTDETGIPIVVTRIGAENAAKNIVISGPHGNERTARFVVLDTQQHFIEKGLSKTDLALYFIPAMSPTLFFADARGVPFVEKEGDKYRLSNNKPKEKKEVENIMNEIYNFLEIPKLHDFIAEKINGTLVHTLIQDQKDSEKPEYGIDANRDCFNVLKSTDSFQTFINNLRARPENIIVIMMHGYENAFSPKENRINKRNGNDQGTVLGPYIVKTHNNIEYGFINDDVKKYLDFMTASLFGYIYNENENLPANDPKNIRQQNYFYQANADVTKLKGEWGRKLYTERNDGQKILCVDIELANSYRDGTRGGNTPYNCEKIVNRDRHFTFFSKKYGEPKGKFADVHRNIIYYLDNRDNQTIAFTKSFYDFLTSYFDYKDITKTVLV